MDLDASIVIPTKNAGSEFKKVLDAIFSQKTDYEYEVICVDSGSSDGTIELIKHYDVNLYEIAPEEFGHGKTRNFGASKGSGHYIVFITQDALPASNTWLQSFIDAMHIDEKVAGGFGKHKVYEGCNVLDARDITAHFDSFGTENTLIYLDDKERYQTDKDYYNILSFFSDNNACVRRSVWEEHPYPEVNFAEDQIWMRAMLERGYKKVYCPEAAVYHSHNFKIRDLFSRYYDEYQASYELFDGFLIVPRWKSVPRAVWRAWKNDRSYIRTLPIGRIEKLKWIHYGFWREFSKFVGGYLGGKSNLYPPAQKEKLDAKYSQQYAQRNK